MRLLVFAFSDTIAARVMTLVSVEADKVLVTSSAQGMQAFLNKTGLGAYDYVVGLGQYSGRDRGDLRIETQCSSQFRGQKDNVRRVAIPYFLQPGPGIKLASGIGNSWCNLIAYRVATQYPGLSFSFVHVPRAFDPPKAAGIIGRQLRRLA